MKQITIFILLIFGMCFADSSLDTGIKLFDNKEYKAAEAFFADFLKENPQDEQAQFFYAKSLYCQNKFKKSLPIFEKLMAEYPTNITYLKFAGLCLHESKDEKGIAYLEKYLKSGDDKDAYEAVIDYCIKEDNTEKIDYYAQKFCRHYASDHDAILEFIYWFIRANRIDLLNAVSTYVLEFPYKSENFTIGAAIYAIIFLIPTVGVFGFCIWWAVSRRKKEVPAGFTDIILAIILVIFLSVTIAFPVSIVPFLMGGGFSATIRQIVISAATVGSSHLGFILCIWVFLVMRKTGTLKDKFLIFRTPKDVLFKYWISGCVLYFPVNYIFKMFPSNPNAEVYNIVKTTEGLLIFGFVAVFIAPVTEELFFRSFIYTTLRQKLSAAWSILLLSAVFAAVHIPQTGSLGSAVCIFLVSCCLCLAKEKNESILPAIMLHSGYNLFNILETLIKRFGS